VAGLTGEQARVDTVRPHAQARVTAIVRAWCGTAAGQEAGPDTDVRVARTAHSTHRQAIVSAAAGVWSNDASYPGDTSTQALRRTCPAKLGYRLIAGC
jgi:hypothetical protein